MKRSLALAGALAAVATAGCGGASQQSACSHAWRKAVQYAQSFGADLPGTVPARQTYDLALATFKASILTPSGPEPLSGCAAPAFGS
jgi:hypothetical protein